MQQKIRTRIAEIEKDKEQAAKQLLAAFQAELNRALMPFESAIIELKALLEPETPPVETPPADAEDNKSTETVK